MAQHDVRLGALEDREAIRELIAAYGPLADAGDAAGVAALFTAEGEYDIGGWGILKGRKELLTIVGNPTHQAWLTQGVAHVLGPPQIRLTGDSALAVNHSVVLLRQADETWQTVRAAGNRWELARQSDGTWKIARRVNRLLDGNLDAQAILSL